MAIKKRTTINFSVSVNFNLRSTTPKNMPTTVRPIVRYNNNKIVLPSDFKIKPNDWNDEKQRARGSQMYDIDKKVTINDRIESLTGKIKSVFKAYTDKHSKYPDQDQFKTLVINELNKSVECEEQAPIADLLTFTEQFIMESRGGLRVSEKGTPLSPNTIKIYTTFKNNLIGFKKKVEKDGKVVRGEYDLNFDNINLEFFENFKEYMMHEKKYALNTLGKHIKTFKTIMAEANFKGLTKTLFTGKRYKATTEETDSIYLNEDELNALYDLDLSGKKRLDRVRDLFLVGCWTGLRFSDFTNIGQDNIIENERGKSIDIKMQKTGRSVAIPILPVVEQIMKKYQGKTENSLPPDDITNQKMNQYLKEIGEIAASDDTIKQRYPKAAFNDNIEQKYTKAGMRIITNTPKYKLIQCHTARRSFATNAYNNKVPTLSIMSITGHRTESQFMKYIKVTPMEHAEIVRDILRGSGLRVVNL